MKIKNIKHPKIYNNIQKIMFRWKPQTAYNFNYHGTLFLMAIIIIALYNNVYLRFNRLLFLSKTYMYNTHTDRHTHTLTRVYIYICILLISICSGSSTFLIRKRVIYFFFHLYLGTYNFCFFFVLS